MAKSFEELHVQTKASNNLLIILVEIVLYLFMMITEIAIFSRFSSLFSLIHILESRSLKLLRSEDPVDQKIPRK